MHLYHRNIHVDASLVTVFYGPRYVSHPPFLERSANPAQVDCVPLQQQIIGMYVLEYSLIITVNDVKLTVPKWRTRQRIWSAQIGHLYISMICTPKHTRDASISPFAKTVHSIIPRSHHPSFHVVLNRV